MTQTSNSTQAPAGPAAVTVPRLTLLTLESVVVTTIRRLAESPSPELQKLSVDLDAAVFDQMAAVLRWELSVLLWGESGLRPAPEPVEVEPLPFPPASSSPTFAEPGAPPMHLVDGGSNGNGNKRES